MVRDMAIQTELVTDACVICLQAPRSHAFAPCGHLCLCEGCTIRTNCVRCPLCRVPTAFGAFRVLLERPLTLRPIKDNPQASTCQMPAALLEWRRTSTEATHCGRSRLQGKALAQLQEMLFETTAKTVMRRRCTTREMQCQTDIALFSTMCAVCDSTLASHAVFPCGHRCVCADCAGGGTIEAHGQYQQQLTHCPWCAADALSVLRIFA